MANPSRLTILTGHTSPLLCTAVSQAGRLLATGEGGKSSDAVIWDLASSQVRHRLCEHDEGVTAVGFSEDDVVLATCGRDRKLFLWEVATGRVAGQGPLPSEASCVVFGGMVRDVKGKETAAYLFATCGKGYVRLHDLDPATSVVSSHPAAKDRDFSSLSFSLDRAHLYAGAVADFSVISVASRTVLAVVPAGAGPVRAVVPLATGSLLVASLEGFSYFAYHQRGYTLTEKAACPGILSCSPARDGSRVLVGTADSVLLCSIGKGAKPSLVTSAHSGPVRALAFRSAGDEIATASQDGTVRVWDVASGRLRATCRPGPRRPTGTTPLSVAYPDAIVVSGWTDGTVTAHDPADGSLLWEIPEAQPAVSGGVTALAVINGAVLCGGGGGEIKTFELKSRRLLSMRKEHTGALISLAAYRGGQRLLTVSRDRTFLTHDLAAGRRLSSHTQPAGSFSAVVPLGDSGDKFVSAGQDKKISVWEDALPAPVKAIAVAHEGDTTCLALGPAGLLASGGTDSLVKLWDVATGTLLTDGVAHTAPLANLAFSPVQGSRVLVSVSEDGSVGIFAAV